MVLRSMDINLIVKDFISSIVREKFSQRRKKALRMMMLCIQLPTTAPTKPLWSRELYMKSSIVGYGDFLCSITEIRLIGMIIPINTTFFMLVRIINITLIITTNTKLLVQSTSTQKRLYYRKKRIFAYISCDNAPHTIS